MFCFFEGEVWVAVAVGWGIQRTNERRGGTDEETHVVEPGDENGKVVHNLNMIIRMLICDLYSTVCSILLYDSRLAYQFILTFLVRTYWFSIISQYDNLNWNTCLEALIMLLKHC